LFHIEQNGMVHASKRVGGGCVGVVGG
jgi:hypothetical protein